MSCYVDQAHAYPHAPKIRGRDVEWCHLLADTPEELHAFAARLGLRREWAHRGTVEHYDLTPGKRRQALALGAVELTREELVERLRARRLALQEGGSR